MSMKKNKTDLPSNNVNRLYLRQIWILMIFFSSCINTNSTNLKRCCLQLKDSESITYLRNNQVVLYKKVLIDLLEDKDSISMENEMGKMLLHFDDEIWTENDSLKTIKFTIISILINRNLDGGSSERLNNFIYKLYKNDAECLFMHCAQKSQQSIIIEILADIYSNLESYDKMNVNREIDSIFKEINISCIEVDSIRIWNSRLVKLKDQYLEFN